MSDSSQIVVDVDKIRQATQMGIPLSITTYTLPHEIELYIGEVLGHFLSELNQERLKDYLIYCINELSTNAKKANTKRIYFKEKNLDIDNPRDYEVGMRTFKEETLSNINYYLQLQKKAGLYVKVMMQVKNDDILIEIRNNSVMTKTEFKRVFDKIARSRQFNTLEEALSQVLDDSEGAGLGLVILILMLKKVGLDDENYQILVEAGETITRITMPTNTEAKKHLADLTEEVVGYINELPQFPENIAQIDKLLNDPDSRLSTIAQLVSNDVALTADLLKLVNSAAFSLSKKCTSISEAVKMVGIKGIRNLLFSIGTMHILGSSSDEQRSLWRHCYRVAYFSYNLSRNFGKNHTVTEDAYVCGLLHDMGKIVFSSLHPDFLAHLESLLDTKKIPPKVLETLIAGINHAEIGARLAEKWNFPPSLIMPIRFHHAVDRAPEDYTHLVSTVALANLMVHYLDGDVEFYQIERRMLELFHIANEVQFSRICKQFQKGFEAEQSV